METITNDNWALSAAVFVPLIGVAVMMFIPRREEQLHKIIALLTSLATLGVGVFILVNFDFDRTQNLQFYVDERWIDVIRSRYIVGMDGMSLPLVLMTMVVVVLCIIYSWDHIPEPG